MISRKTARAGVPGRQSVRIIGGAWRGRRLSFPASPGLRPTPDRVRETLFNWLQYAIAGTRCLDLFAGSGALGFEALSRGAAEVVFVEPEPEVARTIRAQLERFGAGERGRVFAGDAAAYLRSPGEPFDGVFLDPPFGRGLLAEVVPALDAGGRLRAGGFVYLEDARAAGVPALPPHWELVQSKFAGEVGYHLARVHPRLPP